MKLSDAKLRTLREPGKHFDGAGLYLEVMPNGARYWRLKYRVAGKEKRLAFGVYPEVSLKEARDKATEARSQLRAGDDPGAMRKAAKVKAAFESENTLEAVAGEWIEHQSRRWTEVSKERVLASLKNDIFPSLGAQPLAAIRPLDVKHAVLKIERRGAADQATRVLQRVKAIYRWAVVHGRIEANPMLDLMPSEILKPRQVQHRAALSMKEMPDFLRLLRTYGGDIHTRLALRLLVLTALRPGEVRGARWSEIDLDGAVWEIPGERMKMRDPHLVPLSKQAVEVLRQMHSLSGNSDLVFPSPFYPSKPLSENTFNSALARMGFKGTATAHGFRAVFSTAANEHGWDADVIERQLAHKERNEVRAAYHRAAYLQQRRELLQWWAGKVEELEQGAKVIPLHKAA
jgi:integrase